VHHVAANVAGSAGNQDVHAFFDLTNNSAILYKVGTSS
jgi:hypothetical protein